MQGEGSTAAAGLEFFGVTRRKTMRRGKGEMEGPPVLFIKARGQTAGTRIKEPEAVRGGAAVASIFGN